MTLAWDLCGMTLRELGRAFGDLDYAAAAQQVYRTRVRANGGRLQVDLIKLRAICQGI
jgi:hypothetical protein